MKRIFSQVLAFIIMLSLCACQGNLATVNLKDPIAIPDDGIISAATLQQIKDENAIGIFTGESNGLTYEWTVFGSDIQTVKEINLLVTVQKKSAEEVTITLDSNEGFGFYSMLSVHLDETWNAQSATAYQQGKALTSVSLTGSKQTVLNLSLDGTCRTVAVRPDALPDGAVTDSEGSTTPTGEKDKYNTDPVPEGKPQPVEPEDQNVDNSKTYSCTFSIECSTILNNLNMLDPDKLEAVPSGGVILAKTTITFYEGESVFDVLQRLCREKNIHMEASWTPIYNSAYVEGIHNLYEFDCGALSGWMYRVNGWYPNYGSSRYQLQDGDIVEWRYTCDLGSDVGGAYAVGG